MGSPSTRNQSSSPLLLRSEQYALGQLGRGTILVRADLYPIRSYRVDWGAVVGLHSHAPMSAARTPLNGRGGPLPERLALPVVWMACGTVGKTSWTRSHVSRHESQRTDGVSHQAFHPIASSMTRYRGHLLSLTFNQNPFHPCVGVASWHGRQSVRPFSRSKRRSGRSATGRIWSAWSCLP